MSLTVSVEPAALHGTRNPVEYTVAQVTTTRNTTNLLDDGGYVGFITAADADWNIGDLITGSTFTGAGTALNVEMEVTYRGYKSGAYYTTVNIPYIAGYSGLTGVLSRSDHDLECKAEIRNLSDTVLATKVQKPVLIAGLKYFKFDFENLLRDLYEDVNGAILPSDSETITSHAFLDYYVHFIERQTDSDGLVVDCETVDGGDKGAVPIALQSGADIADFTMATVDATKKFLTNIPRQAIRLHPGEYYELFWIFNATSADMKVKIVTNSGTSYVTTVGSVGPAVYRYAVKYSEVIKYTSYAVAIALASSDPNELGEYLTFTTLATPYRNTYRIAFISRMIYDFYTFTECEEFVLKTNRTYYKSGNTKRQLVNDRSREKTVTGIYENDLMSQWMEEMWESDTWMLANTLEEVVVKDTESVLLQKSPIMPKCTIEIQKTRT